MSAQPAENLAADPAWDNVLKMPPRVEGANPILDAPVTDVAYEPPPDVLLNRPEPKKRQRKAKGTGKKPGRPPRAKATEAEAPAAPAPTPQTIVAAPPRHPFFARPVSTTTGWAIFACMFALGVGAALGFWAIR